MSDQWSDTQEEEAEARGKAALETEPRALAARYDRKTDRLIVELASGATFAFPPSLGQGWRQRHPTNWPRWRFLAQASACIGMRWTWTCPCRG